MEGLGNIEPNSGYMTTNRIRGLLWFILLVLSLAGNVSAQLAATPLLEPGAVSTFLQGNVDGAARVYTVHLEKGQGFKVQLERSDAPVSITIESPSGQALMPPVADPYAIKKYDLVAPKTGLYRLMLTARETTDFRLSVSLND